MLHFDIKFDTQLEPLLKPSTNGQVGGLISDATADPRYENLSCWEKDHLFDRTLGKYVHYDDNRANSGTLDCQYQPCPNRFHSQSTRGLGQSRFQRDTRNRDNVLGIFWAQTSPDISHPHPNEVEAFTAARERNTSLPTTSTHDIPPHFPEPTETYVPIITDEPTHETYPPIETFIPREILESISIDARDATDAPTMAAPIYQLTPEQFTTLLNSRNGTATGGSNQGGGGGVKIASPSVFKGDINETREFVDTIKDHLEVKAGTFTDDRKKIIFMKSWMGGSAKEWARAKTEGYVKANSWPTFEAFLEDFQKSYQSPNEANRASIGLDNIKQTKLKPPTAVNLVSNFRTLLAKAGASEVDEGYLPKFKKALKADLLRMILLLPTSDKPTTLANWLNKAIEIEASLIEADDITHGRSTGGSHGGSSNNDYGEPMDLSEVNTSGRGRGPKCYNCQGFGHLSRVCPSKRPDGQGQRGRGGGQTGAGGRPNTDGGAKCFKCGKLGHRIANCPDRKANVRVTTQEDNEDKDDDTSVLAKIDRLMAGMNDEDKEDFRAMYEDF